MPTPPTPLPPLAQSLISADSLGKIPGLESILKAPIVSGVIIGILPSLALIIFIALVPPILRLMSCFQGLHSEGDIDRACIAKFFIFQAHERGSNEADWGRWG